MLLIATKFKMIKSSITETRCGCQLETFALDIWVQISFIFIFKRSFKGWSFLWSQIVLTNFWWISFNLLILCHQTILIRLFMVGVLHFEELRHTTFSRVVFYSWKLNFMVCVIQLHAVLPLRKVVTFRLYEVWSVLYHILVYLRVIIVQLITT